jgi:hypothetical protein
MVGSMKVEVECGRVRTEYIVERSPTQRIITNASHASPGRVVTGDAGDAYCRAA